MIGFSLSEYQKYETKMIKKYAVGNEYSSINVKYKKCNQNKRYFRKLKEKMKISKTRSKNNKEGMIVHGHSAQDSGRRTGRRKGEEEETWKPKSTTCIEKQRAFLTVTWGGLHLTLDDVTTSE